ncbi:MAG: rhomboid family intramembrane serine protease [Saprospiraceae bacterium]|nr:rhomboid family intramembrane serine protease [Saprospiraceae bacterium]
MIFPIGDDQVKGGHFPFFSYASIVLNIACFLYKVSLNPEQQDAFDLYFGAIPAEITSGQDLFTLFTSMFMHGDWWHLIGNMLFLWVFADNIEATVGSFKFGLFYFLGGLVAVFSHIYFNMHSEMPMVGASGAISAVMGAYLVMHPTSRIKMLFLVFPFRITAWIFLGLWIVQQWTYGTSSIASETGGGGVAWWAHIGGFAFGLLAGFYFRTSGHLEGIELEGETTQQQSP